MKKKRTTLVRKFGRLIRRAYMALGERTRNAIMFAGGFVTSGLGLALLGYGFVKAVQTGIFTYFESHRLLVCGQAFLSAILVTIGFMLMVGASPGIEDDESFYN